MARTLSSFRAFLGRQLLGEGFSDHLTWIYNPIRSNPRFCLISSVSLILSHHMTPFHSFRFSSVFSDCGVSTARGGRASVCLSLLYHWVWHVTDTILLLNELKCSMRRSRTNTGGRQTWTESLSELTPLGLFSSL